MTTSSPGAPVASRPFVASVSLVSLILSLLPLRSGRLRGSGRLRLRAIRCRPLHQARDGIGQPGALVPPMLDAIERDPQRLFTFACDRIVKADPLYESPAEAIARVGHQNVEERPFLRATAGESDDYHGVISLSLLRLVCFGAGKLEKDVDYTMETSFVATRLQRLSAQAWKAPTQAPQHLLNATLGDHLHHLLRLLELRKQPIDLLNRDPCARRNPALARRFQELRTRTLGRRHRVNDGLEAADCPFIDLRCLRGARKLAGKLVEQSLHAAHLAHLADLRLEIVEIEALAGLDLSGELLRLFDVDLLVRLLDKAHDVAHAEDARSHAVGVEDFEPVEFLGHPHELDRRSGHLPYRQRRTAARIAVELGQHDARQRQRRTENF